MIKVTVVTVNFNNGCGLKKTIESIQKQDSNQFECLIIDGGSSDSSLSFLQSIDDIRISYVSEKDNGIFDAMNKGFKLSNGDWVIFMNSGDIFYSNNVITDFINSLKNIESCVEVAYGDCVLLSSFKIIKARTNVNCLKEGAAFASHQSMFFRTNLQYDLRYKIFGDLDLLSNILKIYSEKAFFYLGFPVAVYEGGGVSDRVTLIKRKEKVLSLYRRFGFWNLVRTYLLKPNSYRKLLNVFFK